MQQESSNAEIPEGRLDYIYNAYRTALLNRKYSSRMLSRYKRLNKGAEILIAIGSGSGSAGIASLAIFGTLPGKYLWLLVSAAATLLGVIKPVLKIGDEIENYTKLFAGHSNLYFELNDIVEEIRVSRSFTAELQKRYLSSKKLVRDLGTKEDFSRNDNLTRKLQREVNAEIPPNMLWVQPVHPAPSPSGAPRPPPKRVLRSLGSTGRIARPSADLRVLRGRRQ